MSRLVLFALMIALGITLGPDLPWQDERGERPVACSAVPPWLGAASDRAGAVATSVAHAAAHPADAAAVDALAGPSPAIPAPPFRVVTWNLHSGLGAGFALRQPRARIEANLRAIAAAIVAAAPAAAPVDAVALNEVDFAARRSGSFDQATFVAAELARQTGAAYEIVRGETWQRTLPGFEVRFGNAVLVRHPIEEVMICPLDGTGSCPTAPGEAALPPLRATGLRARLLHEPRGALKLTVRAPHGVVDLVATHLDAFLQREREAQAAHLLRMLVPGRPTVLFGDLNAVPSVLTARRLFLAGDRTHDILTSGPLADTRLTWASAHGLASLTSFATFPAAAPRWPLDAVLATPDLDPTAVAVIGGEASDHRGLAVTLRALGDPAARARAARRHRAVRRRQLARLVRCDLPASGGARQWLVLATGFADLLTDAERRLLARGGRVLAAVTGRAEPAL